MAEGSRRPLPARRGDRGPGPGPLPRVPLGPALAVIVALALTISGWLVASGARQDAREAREAADDAETRAAELEQQLAELRSDLQARQGEADELRERLEEAIAVAEEARQAQLTAEEVASAAAEAEEASSEEAATATSLANVTTMVATTDDVTMAVHITDVVDATTLVGFDLREMLADGPTAGQAITVDLAALDSPEPGDCRHTQSRSLATAWLEATEYDVLLRRPDGAPATTALGQRVGEALAFANPDSSLNVTLAVAGEALIDEETVEEDPDLAERLRVAQQNAELTGLGVWGCEESALRDGGPAPTPTPTPTSTATASPAPSPSPS